MAPYRRRRCATGGRLAVLVTYDEDRHVLGAWIGQLGDSGWHAAAPGMPGIEARGGLYPVGHLFWPSCFRLPRCRQNPGP